MPEERLRHAGHQRHHGRLIHIPEGQPLPADQVVHLIAKDAVARMLRNDVGDDVQRYLDRGKRKADPDDQPEMSAPAQT